MDRAFLIARLLLPFAGLAIAVIGQTIGGAIFESLWGIEPLVVIGGILIIVGLVVLVLFYFNDSRAKAIETSQMQAAVAALEADKARLIDEMDARWSVTTAENFDTYRHDLLRPMMRIVGKEQDLMDRLAATGLPGDVDLQELHEEFGRQSLSFRLILSNIQALIDLVGAKGAPEGAAVEPSTIVGNICQSYDPLARELQKDLSWYSVPDQFGLVYSDGSALDHIVTNLIDNALRFAKTQVVISLSKDLTHFVIRVKDDGPGIPEQYQQVIFDRGWTREVARREEKTSSGLGLFIASSLARLYGGDLLVESVPEPDPGHHTEFALFLPLSHPG